ncbi:hypothetical protein [Sorangium sp. So ce1151]|uniref:hypothetical protein n=1 Tax=Sorangium sp. So ce1151 TaxID=3133332 RepID=UPI003F62DA22
MPVRTTLTRTPGPTEEDLKNELLNELRTPKPAGEPDVIIQGVAPAGVHLFVIWSKWTGLEQVVRSRIILDAYEEWKGEEEALRVTVSMGLLPEEAKSMGIS